LRPDEIMDIIRYTAEDVNSGSSPGFDEFIGYGRINMDTALVPIKLTASSAK
jgi:thermitase